MQHGRRDRVHVGVTGLGALLVSIGLAWVAQRPGATPGVLQALAPVLAIAAYVGGMTATSCGFLGLRFRGVLWTAAGWVAVLLAARLLVEPGIAVAAVGRLPEGLLESWTTLSNHALWFVGVPLEVVFGAATCGAILVGLALGSIDSAPRTLTGVPARSQWSAQP